MARASLMKDVGNGWILKQRFDLSSQKEWAERQPRKEQCEQSIEAAQCTAYSGAESGPAEVRNQPGIGKRAVPSGRGSCVPGSGAHSCGETVAGGP